ncbi:hypothetical protein BGZ65_012436 [Modicella reniformis]|uniref:Uncharacterized protein n=1 Tax=Modicella reniformis TaxID=1440133 RepID=A0A9P6IQS7_9FUNG|nr:hypothetical protein BGZ65_012436 [Modicella reniformis]
MTEIADAMSLLGVFSPSLPTPTMIKVFGQTLLEKLVERKTLPDVTFDESAVLKAVRLRKNGNRDAASEALKDLARKEMLMFNDL